MLSKRNVRAALWCGRSEECRSRVSEWSSSSSEAVEVSEWVVREESVRRCCVASSSSMTANNNFWFVQFTIRPRIFIFCFSFYFVFVDCRVICVFDCSLSLSFRWVVGFCCDVERWLSALLLTVSPFNIWLLDLHVFYHISRSFLTPYVFFCYTCFPSSHSILISFIIGSKC